LFKPDLIDAVVAASAFSGINELMLEAAATKPTVDNVAAERKPASCSS